MKTDPGRFIEVNGVSLYVEEHGAGVPVLLMHGFPDSTRLWRNQVPFLVSNGFRVITPDLRGFGRSGRPQEVAAYRLQSVVEDVTGLMDALGIETAHVVGHDWGAALAWLTAALAPDRVRRLVVISVPHPLAPVTLRQHEMAWYQLFFQFAGIAEATIKADNWAWLRMFSRGNGDVGQWIEDLSRCGALTASLNWYRANLAPHMPGPQPSLPPVQAPVLGIWSDGDHYLDGERMRQSAAWVAGPWRYAQIAGASHWVPLDAPGQLNDLLLDWLRLPRLPAGAARHSMRTGRQGDIDPILRRDTVTTSAGTPIDPQFHIIDGLSIRFAQSQGRHDDALALRSCNSDRQWVAIGFAAAPVVGGDAAGASTGWDAT